MCVCVCVCVSAGWTGVCLLNDGSEGQRADWILRVAVGKEIQYRWR